MLFFALLMIVLWARVIFIVRLTETLGSYIKMIQMSMDGLCTWLVMFIFALLTFSLIFWMNYSFFTGIEFNKERGCESMRSCMKLLFKTSLGEVNLNDEKGDVFT